MSLFDTSNLLFLVLFIWRYLRQVVHLFSFWAYRPAPVRAHPKFTSRDTTVILPTCDPRNQDFLGCLHSICINEPAKIIIVAAGKVIEHEVKEIIQEQSLIWQRTLAKQPHIVVASTNVANKRTQVAKAIPMIETPITILINDHVVWGPRFIQNAIAPFEDGTVGLVGTNKRVFRENKPTITQQFWNMIGGLYLERHNFEIRSTNAIDGGVFVISGRTSALRTGIIQDSNFLKDFTNERFLFGLLGPIAPDDDNYITRFMVSHGWKIKIQYTEDAMIWTTLGTYPKFASQCLRWMRTTWRSNMTSLFTDRCVWRAQPWCVYAVYLSSFTNLILFYDPAMLWAFWGSDVYAVTGRAGTMALITWVVAFKMVKVFPWFVRYPQDLFMLPGYFLFTWYHSLLKLWALLTFWDPTWSGRDLSAIQVEG